MRDGDTPDERATAVDVNTAALGAGRGARNHHILQNRIAGVNVNPSALGSRAIHDDELGQGGSRTGLHVNGPANAAGGSIPDGKAFNQRMESGGHLDA